jgi:hypothetical protein
MNIFAKEIFPVAKYILKIKFYILLKFTVITLQVENFNDIYHQKQTMKSVSFNHLQMIFLFCFKQNSIQILYCYLIATNEAEHRNVWCQ